MSQCLEGATRMGRYEIGRRALDLGAIEAYDMSTECVITKLMWAIARADSTDEVRKIMHTDYCGEVNVSPSGLREQGR